VRRDAAADGLVASDVVKERADEVKQARPTREGVAAAAPAAAVNRAGRTRDITSLEIIAWERQRDLLRPKLIRTCVGRHEDGKEVGE
jgi:hypothetical protein